MDRTRDRKARRARTRSGSRSRCDRRTHRSLERSIAPSRRYLRTRSSEMAKCVIRARLRELPEVGGLCGRSCEIVEQRVDLARARAPGVAGVAGCERAAIGEGAVGVLDVGQVQ